MISFNLFLFPSICCTLVINIEFWLDRFTLLKARTPYKSQLHLSDESNLLFMFIITLFRLKTISTVGMLASVVFVWCQMAWHYRTLVPTALVSSSHTYWAHESAALYSFTTSPFLWLIQKALEGASREPLREARGQTTCHLFPGVRFHCLIDILTLFPYATTRYCLKENFHIILLYLALVMMAWRGFH